MEYDIMKKEDEKYSWLYKNNYRDGQWRKLASIVLRELRHPNNHLSSLMDFGCGRGSAIDFFVKKGFYCGGVEISSFLCDRLRDEAKKVYHTSIDNLFMVKDKSYDIGFSNDVLEHIPETYVGRSVEEMSRVTRDYLFLRISLLPSKNLSKEGENLHLTLWNVEKWQNLLEKFGSVKKIRKPLSKHVTFILKFGIH